MQIATTLFLGSMLSHASEALRPNLVPHVSGGATAEKGDIPYMAALFQKDKNLDYSFVCSGSIIGERWILTAARCTYDVAGLKEGTLLSGDCDETFVAVGEIYATSKNEMHRVRRCHRFPLYTNTFYFITFVDIALLQLEESLVWTPFVSPIEIGPLDDEHHERTVYTAGYGVESKAEKENLKCDSNILSYLQLKTVGFEECTEWHTIKPRYQICAKSSVPGGTCKGDAGGPLVDSVTRKQVGVTSIGRECTGGIPTVFTRAWFYYEWIQLETGMANRTESYF